MSADTPEKIRALNDFISITQAKEEVARFFLESSEWDSEAATTNYFDSDEGRIVESGASEPSGSMDTNDLYDDEDNGMKDVISHRAPPVSNGVGTSKRNNASNRFATLRDIQPSNQDSEDEDDRKQNYFAGGEKSGLSVQNPDSHDAQESSSADHVRRIIEQATQAAQRRLAGERVEDDDREDDELGLRNSRFVGTGYTLGDDTTPSQIIPSRSPILPTRARKVMRTLTLYRNGFIIEDGPLRQYDDPESAQLLQQIRDGRVPLNVFNVGVGEQVDLNIVRKQGDDYIPARNNWSGAGQRLGSVVPTSPSLSQSILPEPPVAKKSQTPPASVHDPDRPTISIQIRFSDGTRLVVKFNPTQSVGDLYAFVGQTKHSQGREFVLQTGGMPGRELKDKERQLGEEGIGGGVVIQKWAS